MNTRSGARPVVAALVGMMAVIATGCAGARSAAPPKAEPDPETVVMTGYGQEARSGVTGAISSLTEKDLKDVRVARTEELLWGRVAGLDVRRRTDGTFSLRIRGVGSFMGSGEPLIVVDGVPLLADRDLWSINPMDIARIDVLKDASSLALYGSRGGNGVIVITTKRGR